MAATPRSNAPSKMVKNRSRLSSVSSIPRRIFTVTGMCGGTASRTRLTISSAVSSWPSKNPPRHRPKTFFTGQPKLMSITSKPAATNRCAAGPKSIRIGPHQLPANRMLFVGDAQRR